MLKMETPTAAKELPFLTLQEGELSGVYTPVAVIDYNPVTTYAANDVLAHSMDIVFDSGLSASSLWFTTNCKSATLTQLLADGATNSEEDSTKSVLSAVLSGPVLPAGQFLLIDAPLQSKDHQVHRLVDSVLTQSTMVGSQ